MWLNSAFKSAWKEVMQSSRIHKYITQQADLYLFPIQAIIVIFSPSQDMYLKKTAEENKASFTNILVSFSFMHTHR